MSRHRRCSRGFQEILVCIDNTAPTASFAITGATFNGNPIVAVDCGKFPVVIHMDVTDRTNVDSRGNPFHATWDVGFCLEQA